MKHFCLLLALFLLLTGCARAPETQAMLVFIEDAEGCIVENNGQYILPGEDAVFHLRFDYGLSLAGTDYGGKFRTETNQRSITLTLEDVRCPTRVQLQLTYNYAEITYHANGGYALHSTEAQTTINYSLHNHTRPNTDIGTDLFAREGHTLVSWNTKPDGSGTQIGLGSRISISESNTDLYAQWAAWCPSSDFTYTTENNALTITGYTGNADPLVIPEIINGLEVTAIAAGAFQDCSAKTLILPKSMDHVAEGAFVNCGFETVVLFDNIISIHDASFSDCNHLRTLRINAVEAPFGYIFRKESCYADKVDMLINAQGKQKLVFYGGCSMWYNLDGSMVRRELKENYNIINMGLNGTVNSLVQMQIMGAFLEYGDILFHTPELSSRQQLLTNTDMLDTDTFLWCGIENNYDLFTYVDLQTVGGAFDSLCAYLGRKDGRTTYTEIYTDENDRIYMDITGSIPFYRNTTKETLGDQVFLDPERIDTSSIARLKQCYDWYQNQGVRIYISYACINLDAVPEEQLGNAQALEDAFVAAVTSMEGPVLVSQMEDFLYHNEDFYDTNYHLRSEQAQQNTAIWLRDLLVQMEEDRLWKGSEE